MFKDKFLLKFWATLITIGLLAIASGMYHNGKNAVPAENKCLNKYPNLELPKTKFQATKV